MKEQRFSVGQSCGVEAGQVRHTEAIWSAGADIPATL